MPPTDGLAAVQRQHRWRLPEPLPMDQGGLTSFSRTERGLPNNRIFRNFRTWKRYTGGLAQDILYLRHQEQCL